MDKVMFHHSGDHRFLNTALLQNSEAEPLGDATVLLLLEYLYYFRYNDIIAPIA